MCISKKKQVITVMLGLVEVLILTFLSACTDSTLPSLSLSNELVSNAPKSYHTDFEQTNTPSVEITVTPDDLKESAEIPIQEYTVRQEKEGSVYTVVVKWDVVPFSEAYPQLVDDPFYRGEEDITFNKNYRIQLFDNESNLLQTIPLELDIFAGISFQDVNFDEYTDIVANIGGTLNEAHELYTWSVSTQKFTKATYSGFEILSYFEVHDGYLMNWVKNTASLGMIQKLVWSENTLVLESEKSYELEE